MNATRTVYLTPPLLGNANIKEKITCIRAHRERLFYVAPEHNHNKLIFHNYGHGGAGWTFLFGCVNESLRQFERELLQNSSLRNAPITIIGAGCHGLLTAVMLARNGHSVRIVAKEMREIPSYKAAGFFFPRARKCSTASEKAIFENLGIESYRTYLSIIQGTHPFINSGPQLLPAYYSPAIDPEFGPYIMHGLMNTPEKVMINFGNDKIFQAMEYQTIFINAAVLMHQLQSTIEQLGIKVTQQEIATFNELADPIIFNCTGLGAKQLTHDPRIIPVQGHLIALKNQPEAPALAYMINAKIVMRDLQGRPRDELIYFAPKDEGILGVTFIRGQDSLTANQHEFERLLQRCHDFFGT